MLTAFRCWPTVVDLAIGNLGTVLLLVVCLMMLSEFRGPAWGGPACLAVASLFKPWMIGLVLYFVLQRRYRAAVGACVGSLVGLAVLFSLVGWWQFVPFVRAMRLYSHQPTLVALSVPGLLSMFTADNGVGVVPFVRSEAARLSSLALIAAAAAVFLWRVWSTSSLRSATDNKRVAITVSLPVLLLVLPVAHQHYFLLLLPAVWAGLSVWRRPDWACRTAAVAALLAYLFISRPSAGLNPVPDAARDGWGRLRLLVTPAAAIMTLSSGLLLAAGLRRDGDVEARWSPAA